MKFLVFGGTGFIGRNLVNYLRDKGREVTSVSISGGENSVSLDITKAGEYKKLDVLPDVVINCASRIPAKGKTSTDPDFLKELFHTNVTGAANIANWAVEKKVPRLINCSTLVVVNKPWPEPLTEDYVELPQGIHVGYSMSKLSQEQIMGQCVAGSDTKLLHTRLSAVYGPEMKPEGIIFKLLEKLAQNEEIRLTNAEKNTLDLIHVKDVCKALYELGVNGYNHRIINLANGKEISILKLAGTLREITGSNSGIHNSDTGGLSSKAKIGVSRLQNYIGPVYEEFLNPEEGLRDLVENYKIRA